MYNMYIYYIDFNRSNLEYPIFRRLTRHVAALQLPCEFTVQRLFRTFVLPWDFMFKHVFNNLVRPIVSSPVGQGEPSYVEPFNVPNFAVEDCPTVFDDLNLSFGTRGHLFSDTMCGLSLWYLQSFVMMLPVLRCAAKTVSWP